MSVDLDHNKVLAKLKHSMLQFIVLLKSLTPLQVQKLVQFERCEENILDDKVYQCLERSSLNEIEIFIRFAQNPPHDLQNQKLFHLGNNPDVTTKMIISIGCLFRLLLLQEMLHNYFSLNHLISLPTIIPQLSPDQQLKFSQMFQNLLNQLLPDTLVNLHTQVTQSEDVRYEILNDILQYEQDSIIMFHPLNSLFNFELDDLLAFQKSFIQLQPIQLVQLIRLLQLDPLQIMEIRQLLSPDLSGKLGLQTLFEKEKEEIVIDDMIDIDDDDNEADDSQKDDSSECLLAVQILDQPPEQTVYRRNLKPFPSVIITGDEKSVLRSNESLLLVPVLYRCDTLTPTDYLKGNTPMKVTVGSAVTFKKLKINVTSRQLNDCLFCIRFELYRVASSNGPRELLTTQQSNPILVVSHSSLIKKSSQVLPTILEVIPSTGTCTGGTRVAILGANFIDSPSVRIKFDNIEVQPEYHGPSTLLCTTPQHGPGLVTVYVSNNSKSWSESYAHFIYENSEPQPQAFPIDVYSSNHLCSTIFDGCYQSLEDILISNPSMDLNSLNFRGFSPLHYAAALGNVEIAQLLLQFPGIDIDVRDKFGNSPLFWAIYNGHSNMVSFLLHSGCNPDVPNYSCETLLHLVSVFPAIHPNLPEVLLQFGLNPNALGASGQTPLHNACALGDIRTAYSLLKCGAFLHAQDFFGETPLHWAVRENQVSAVSLLIKAGVDVNQIDKFGETALHIATIAGLSEIVNLILGSNRLSKQTLNSVSDKAFSGKSAIFDINALFNTLKINAVDEHDNSRCHSLLTNTTTENCLCVQ